MVSLSRELGLFQVTVAGVGIILGAGIYALIGIAAGSAGNATWLSFLISAIVAVFTGLSYAELSSMYKGDAGEFDYISQGFNRPYAIISSLMIIFAGIVSAAAVALGFGGYLAGILGLPMIIGGVILVFIMSYINFKGIEESSNFNTVSTIIEFLGLIIIIILGVKYFGKVDYFDMPKGGSGLFSAAALVFFAYMGFESIIKLREETKNPERPIPLGLIYSLIITSILYVLVAAAAVSILDWQELNQSKAPLASVAAKALGPAAFIVLAIIALFSTSNTVLITLVTTSRLVYGVAKRNALPKIFAKVHKKNRTPYIAVLLMLITVIIFTLLGDIELVANLTNVLLFLVFGTVNASLIALRYKQKKRKRPFKAPLNIGNLPILAVLGVITSFIMLIFAIINLF